MKHIWSVLCNKSIIDTDSNLISLIDCIEEINFSQDISKNNEIKDKLILPISLQIVNFWLIEKNDSNKLNIKIEIIGPENTKIQEITGDFEIQNNYKRYRTRININGIHILGGGRYYLNVYFRTNKIKDFDKASELPLDVNLNYKINNK